MPDRMIVLDSFALMAYFLREKNGDAVQHLIKQAKNKTRILKLCAINWGEIYYNIVRGKGVQAAEKYLMLMEELPVDIVDVDRSLIMEAALLKSKYALSYADCFAAALAQRENCPVLTGDKEFKQLPPAIKVQFLS